MTTSLFKSMNAPQLRIWCDDQRAEDAGVTDLDEVKHPSPGDGGNTDFRRFIRFQGFTYVTESEELAEYLRNSPRYGIDFVEKGQNGEQDEWKNRLKDVDRPDIWTETVLEHFKDGGEVDRCEFDCGYAHYQKNQLTRHENRCPERPSEIQETEEESAE